MTQGDLTAHSTRNSEWAEYPLLSELLSLVVDVAPATEVLCRTETDWGGASSSPRDWNP